MPLLSTIGAAAARAFGFLRSLVAGGYSVANSLRFNSGSSDNLTFTPSSSSNRRTFTLSTWVKRSKLGTSQIIFGASSANYDRIGFNSNDKIEVYIYNNPTSTIRISTQVFRDVSAWYHIVVAFDTTNATAQNRCRIYINGTEITTWDLNNTVTQNLDTGFNQNVIQYIGRYGLGDYFDGYLAEVYSINGSQLTPSSFGSTDTDTGVWIPKAYTGTYGTNGFFLKFSNSASLGTDSSGNGNTFTVNNLTSVDQTTDTPTNNFCTGNPLNVPTSSLPIFTNGNLTWESSGNTTSNFGGSSTIGVTQGKWYIEAKATLDETYSRNAIGISGEVSTLARNNSTFESNSTINYLSENGNKSVNGSGSAYGNTYTTGDIIGIALDLDNGYVYFSKNGTWQNSGVPTSGSSGTGGIAVTSVSSTTDGAYFIYQADTSGVASTPSKFDFNFGNPPFTIASGNADANGYGNFEYAVPSGYYALCTKNLADFG